MPVPKPGFEDKVFYVWFDAPIGYIAAAVEWSEAAPGRDWRDWWQCGDDVRYVQFLAKDNVPFHAISFPATLLGSGLPFKLVDVIKGFNWLTFEGGKFSTSGRRGIFTDTALDLLPADTWRWWLAANAPEKADTDFTVARFVDGVNKDLADVFGNLVNRCLAFAAARFDSTSCRRLASRSARTQARRASSTRTWRACARHHEGLALRKAAEEVRAIWKLANAYLTEAAPGPPSRTTPSGRRPSSTRASTWCASRPSPPGRSFRRAAEKVLCSLGEAAGPRALAAGRQARAFGIPAGRRIAVPPVLFPKIAVAALAAAHAS